jgi:hypothetical protein
VRVESEGYKIGDPEQVGARAHTQQPVDVAPWRGKDLVQHAACERLQIKASTWCCSRDATRGSRPICRIRQQRVCMAGCARGRVSGICVRRCSWARVFCVLPEIGGRRSESRSAPAEDPFARPFCSAGSSLVLARRQRTCHGSRNGG